jgi:integrase
VRRLTAKEMQSILDAPDPARRMGIRDRAMLHLCFAGGMRVSELIGIRVVDVRLHPEPSVLIHGKGRRERCVPLWRETASAVRAWLSVRAEIPALELFINARSGCMTRAGFEYILRKHVHIAEKRCPSLASKRISPHVLRHYLPFPTMSSDMEEPGDRSIIAGLNANRVDQSPDIVLSALQTSKELHVLSRLVMRPGVEWEQVRSPFVSLVV